MVASGEIEDNVIFQLRVQTALPDKTRTINQKYLIKIMDVSARCYSLHHQCCALQLDLSAYEKEISKGNRLYCCPLKLVE